MDLLLFTTISTEQLLLVILSNALQSTQVPFNGKRFPHRGKIQKSDREPQKETQTTEQKSCSSVN